MKSVYHCKYIYLVNSHENWTILRQRDLEGSKLKNCFIAIWIFGILHVIYARKSGKA